MASAWPKLQTNPLNKPKHEDDSPFMGGFVTINKLEALVRDKVAAMTHNNISYVSPAEETKEERLWRHPDIRNERTQTISFLKSERKLTKIDKHAPQSFNRGVYWSVFAACVQNLIHLRSGLNTNLEANYSKCSRPISHYP